LREVLDDKTSINGYSRLYASVFDCLKVYPTHGVIGKMDFTGVFCISSPFFAKNG
jgi:hypothetical protein